MKIRGSTTNYGQPIGILMVNTTFPRIPGDIGNATTFDFPVIYKVINRANYSTVVDDPDSSLIKDFVYAAKELQEAGCKAVFTSCGFLAAFQKEIASALNVPFISSSLIQVKYVYDFLPRGKTIGILTAFEKKLTERHFKSVGAENIPKTVIGLEGTYFGDFLKNIPNEFDIGQAKEDMIFVTRKLMQNDPNVGAIVLECTNMPPFAQDVAQEANVPVYDIISLVNYVERGIVRQKFKGFM